MEVPAVFDAAPVELTVLTSTTVKKCPCLARFCRLWSCPWTAASRGRAAIECWFGCYALKSCRSGCLAFSAQIDPTRSSTTLPKVRLSSPIRPMLVAARTARKADHVEKRDPRSADTKRRVGHMIRLESLGIVFWRLKVFLKKIYLFYFLALVGVCCCMRAFSSCDE